MRHYSTCQWIGNKSSSGATSLDVTGLVAGTSYFIRVRAMNGSGTSPNALTGFNQFTITKAPDALDPSNEQSSSFKAKWTSVFGANEYELYVVEDNTGSGVPNYHRSQF